MPKQIIIFIGHPAGGKTSAAYKLAEKLGDSKVIAVDEIKTEISGSVFGRDDRERELWFQEINKQIKEGLESFNNMIIDEGFFTQELFDKIMVGLDQVKKFIVEITFGLDEHLCRSKARGDLLEPVRRMYNLWQSVPEDKRIEPNLVVRDATLDSEKIADLIIKNL